MTANLLCGFLQAATNIRYGGCQYHKALSNYYVLNEGIKAWNKHPYFSKEFFEEIKEAVNENLDVSLFSVNLWYQRLLKKFTTHKNTIRN